MLNVNEYLKNPCKSSSIPFWKQKYVTVPSNMLIVHNDDYAIERYSDYRDEPYFRLIHDLKNIRPCDTENFEVVDNAYLLIDEFVELINKCYEDLDVSKKQLIDHQITPVFCRNLWLLIKDKRTGEIIGGGIGDFDAKTGEGIIDWVQVLPSCRKQGLGQFIVNYLLSEMQKIAEFATVSGKINNITQPEKLYRKCGFTGNDVWHVLTKID